MTVDKDSIGNRLIIIITLIISVTLNAIDLHVNAITRGGNSNKSLI